MRIDACGISCEVCKLYKQKMCPGCMPGTDEAAPAFQEKLKEMIGLPCPVLACAIEHKVNHCLGCEQFPCDVHYQGFPYSKGFLNVFKKFIKEQKAFL